ncbi:MAG: hypothetical protein AAF329_25455 [Cyanobacteria bacterium P01_A01_bin.17]
MGFLYLLVIIVATYWLYQRFIVKPNRTKNGSSPSASQASDQRPDSGPYILQPDGFQREKYEIERRAEKLKAHIINNATEPDEDGFVGFVTSWTHQFHIRERDTGKTYQGRIKVGDGFMITIKLEGWRERRETLDLRDVEEIR